MEDRGRGEVITRMYYEDILFKAFDDCRRAESSRVVADFSNAALAFYDALEPDLQRKLDPPYSQIQADVDEAVKKVREETQSLTNPLEQAGYYQARAAEIEWENARRLYTAVIKVLSKEKLLLKRREVEARSVARRRK